MSRNAGEIGMASVKGPRLLVVLLDGADWKLIEPLVSRGELPGLASLLERDEALGAVLESTLPPVTFPAWTTFLTGVGPGVHGVLDFARWQPGTYRVSFTGGGAARRSRTVLEDLAEAGKKVACISVPGTWPPMDLPGGFVLSGFDAPVAIGPGPGFARPAEVYERVVKEHGPWVYADVDELKVGTGWHERALSRLLEGLERKRRIALSLLADRPWDLFMLHIGETDTAGHHFYAHHDPQSPRRAGPVSRLEAEALSQVYRAADRLLADVVSASGECSVLVASDHGIEGASDRVLHPNRALESAGLLRFARARHGRLSRLEAPARQLALRFLPARLKEALARKAGRTAGLVESRRRLEGIDLAASLAFSEELGYAPSVRINVRGREPMGLVAPEEAGAVQRALRSLLLSLRDVEDGAALVDAVWTRDEVIRGSAADEAPDLYFRPAKVCGYRYTVLPSGGRPGPFTTRLQGEARLGGKGRGPTGVHRREGVLILAPSGGRRIDPEALRRAMVEGRPAVPIGSCAATMMDLCGLPPRVDLSWGSLCAGRTDRGPAASPPEEGDGGYTPEQEELVSARLRSLGYLD